MSGTATEILAIQEAHLSRMMREAQVIDTALKPLYRQIAKNFVDTMMLRQPVNLPRLASRKRRRHWTRQVRRSWMDLKIIL